MKPLLGEKVALVTGAASGIGRAIALRFASEGARVVVADRQPGPREGGEPTHELIAARGGEARFAPCDVTDAADREAAVRVTDELGGVDVLVNSAGILSGGDFFDVTEDEYDRLMDVNVKAVFFMCQAAAKRMAAAGGGAIVNLSSISGQQGSGTYATYCTSKGAVRLLTLSLADELGRRGIRVNALYPGITATTMMTVDVPVVGSDVGEALAATNPLGRFGRPEDVADAALYLASDLAGYVNGASLAVDGGSLRV